MSLEAVQNFRAHAATDPVLQRTCARALQVGEAQRVVEEAAQRGFVFTKAELAQCLSEGELSDAELELVAGGGNSGAQGIGMTEDPRKTA